MDFHLSDHYHKVLSYLIISGSNVVESLSHSLASSQLFTVEDLQEIKKKQNNKDKAETFLNLVVSRNCEDVFVKCLEQRLPNVSKNLMTSQNKDEPANLAARSEVTSEVDTGQLLHEYKAVSCERDIINEELQRMSEELKKVTEKLVQSQAESENLMRQNMSDQQELSMLRRKSLIGGGNPIINKMYENMLERYEELKLTHEIHLQKLSEELDGQKKLQEKLDSYAMELNEVRRTCSTIAVDRDVLSHQVQTMNERNELLQRDLHRVREERTLVKREYSLVMSERDAVHREIEKLQEEIITINKQLAESIAERKTIVEDRDKLSAQLKSVNKDKRDELATSNDLAALQDELFVVQRERKQALDECDVQVRELYTVRKSQEVANEMILKLRTENEGFLAKIESLKGELKDANKEAKDATRNRDVAFMEREKMRCERDEIKKTYDQLEEEREKIMKQLEVEMKEHDATKDMKKRAVRELRENRAQRVGGGRAGTGGTRDNTNSHDSAIDAGEWGSEDLSTIDGGHRRLRTFTHKLPRQPDINLETGLFVTRSGCRGIAIGDRVVSINDTVVDSNNASQLQRLIPNSVNSCTVRVVRSSSPPLNESQCSREHDNVSMNAEYEPSSTNTMVYSMRQNVISVIKTVDVECQTPDSLRMKRNHTKNYVANNFSPNSSEIPTHADFITPIIQRSCHQHANSIACVSSGAESRQSSSTFSDSTQHSLQASALPRQSSQKSSDSNVSFNRSSSAKREKKKSKMASSRYWTKMRKAISLSSKSKNSSGGTWPRLESPPIPGLISGGRLSVFTKKKNRPSLSPATFTPPSMESAGRTPPTVIRSMRSPPNSPIEGCLTPKSFQDTSSSVSYLSHRRTHQLQSTARKRQRPVSVPIDTNQPLTLWNDHNSSNNNNSASPRQQPSTQRSPPLQESPLESSSATVVSELSSNVRSSTSHDTSSISTNHSGRSKLSSQSNIFHDIHHPIKTSVTSVQQTMTNILQANARPIGSVGTPPSFLRQLSVPVSASSEKIMTLPDSLPSPRRLHPNGQSAKVVNSPVNNLQPRTTHSLPRPSSAKTPTSRTSSYASVDTHKTKSLDYKRIRMPSEISVGIKLSGSEKGSISLSSDRSTPILFTTRSQSPATPILEMSIPSVPGSAVSSLSNISATSARVRRPPISPEPRYVGMIKGTDPIGISIVGGGEKGGIFVSRIAEESLAARAGLEYGDQLLEYNGINLRTANEAQARVIMSQTQLGDNIRFLVQNNLEKFRSSIESNLSDTLGFVKGTKSSSLLTPSDEKDEGTITPEVTPRASPQVEDALRSQALSQPRYIFMNGNCSHVTLLGGNRTGIFISSFANSNMETSSGLKVGDKLIEYNSVDLQHTTLERASLLLSKPSGNSSLQVIYDPIEFSKLKTASGDFFYVRALYDNLVEQSSGNLSFAKNSILLVDDTYIDHTMGSWSAWFVDEHGEKTTHGKIPSKFMVERESFLQRDFDDSASCAGSIAGKKLGGTGRRSFFKRRKPHRTSSRSSGEIRLHKSVSETSIESTETNFEHMGAAYQVVERHVCENRRPVVIFGPHSNNVRERLVRDYAASFVRCQLDVLSNIHDNHDKNIIETYKEPTYTLALRVETMKREMQKNRHVLLDLTQAAVDRLHFHKIYPIIIFIDYSSAKKVKESQDRVPGREKISMKQSKEIFERSNSTRRRLCWKYLGTGYILNMKITMHGGSPWGFKMTGGKEFRQPLAIGKVTSGGKAARAGVVEGHHILSVNGEDVAELSHLDVQNRIKNSKATLTLVLSNAPPPSKPKQVEETVPAPIFSAKVMSSNPPSSVTSSNKFSSKPTSYSSSAKSPTVSAAAMSSSRSPKAYSPPHSKTSSYEESRKNGPDIEYKKVDSRDSQRRLYDEAENTGWSPSAHQSTYQSPSMQALARSGGSSYSDVPDSEKAKVELSSEIRDLILEEESMKQNGTSRGVNGSLRPTGANIYDPPRSQPTNYPQPTYQQPAPDKSKAIGNISKFLQTSGAKHGPPTFAKALNDLVCPYGDPAVLEVRVGNTLPTPTVIWFHNGKPFRASKEKDIKILSVGLINTVVIGEFTPEFSGRYQCTLTSKNGSVSCSSLLTAEQLPTGYVSSTTSYSTPAPRSSYQPQPTTNKSSSVMASQSIGLYNPGVANEAYAAQTGKRQGKDADDEEESAVMRALREDNMIESKPQHKSRSMRMLEETLLPESEDL